MRITVFMKHLKACRSIFSMLYRSSFEDVMMVLLSFTFLLYFVFYSLKRWTGFVNVASHKDQTNNYFFTLTRNQCQQSKSYLVRVCRIPSVRWAADQNLRLTFSCDYSYHDGKSTCIMGHQSWKFAAGAQFTIPYNVKLTLFSPCCSSCSQSQM